MKAGRIFIFLLLCTLFANYSMGQRTHVLSAGFGTSYYFGDLSDKFNSSFMRPAGGIYYTNYIMSQLSFRAGVSYTVIKSDDSFANDALRKQRNLSFRSSIAEFSGVLIYEILRDKNFGNSWQGKPHFTPYVFAGISLFHFNPQSRFESEWVDLQPLGTEGQFLTEGAGGYSRLQMSLPHGVGVSVRLTQRMGLSLEVGYRLTFTDYLDDVSTSYPNSSELFEQQGATAVALANRSGGLYPDGSKRGNPEANDGYTIFLFTVNYYLGRFGTFKR